MYFLNNKLKYIKSKVKNANHKIQCSSLITNYNMDNKFPCKDSINFNYNTNNNNNGKKKKKKKAKAKIKKAKTNVELDDIVVKQDINSSTTKEDQYDQRDIKEEFENDILKTNEVLICTAFADEGAAGDINTVLTKKIIDEENVEVEKKKKEFIQEKMNIISKSDKEFIEKIILSFNLPIKIAKSILKWKNSIKVKQDPENSNFSFNQNSLPAVPKPSADEIYAHLNVSRTISDDLTCITGILSQMQSLPQYIEDTEEQYQKAESNLITAYKNEKEMDNSISEGSDSNENVNWKPSQHCHSEMSDEEDNESVSKNLEIEEMDKSIQLRDKRPGDQCHSGVDKGVEITDEEIFFLSESEISSGVLCEESEIFLRGRDIPKIRIYDEKNNFLKVPDDFIDYPPSRKDKKQLLLNQIHFPIEKQNKSTGTETVNLKTDVEHLLVNLIDAEIDKRSKNKQKSSAGKVSIASSTDKLEDEDVFCQTVSYSSLSYNEECEKIHDDKVKKFNKTSDKPSSYFKKKYLKKIDSKDFQGERNERRNPIDKENHMSNEILKSNKKTKFIKQYLSFCDCTCTTKKKKA